MANASDKPATTATKGFVFGALRANQGESSTSAHAGEQVDPTNVGGFGNFGRGSAQAAQAAQAAAARKTPPPVMPKGAGGGGSRGLSLLGTVLSGSKKWARSAQASVAAKASK